MDWVGCGWLELGWAVFWSVGWVGEIGSVLIPH